MGIIIAIHIIACVLLIIIILIQAGRGGGLVESFSSVESMFGPKTNAFLTRTTTTLSILFFLTCVSLAFLSARQSRSLIRDTKSEPAKQLAPQIPKTEEKAPAVKAETPAVKVEAPDVKKEAPQKEQTPEPAKKEQAQGVPKAE